MTRNGIVCVEWLGPAPLTVLANRPEKGDVPTVYRVDLDGETIYVGCTKYPVAFRLYQHSRRRNEFGRVLRSHGDRLTVWTIPGACRRVEGRLIHTLQPRFNERLRHLPAQIAKPRKSLARHRALYDRRAA